MSFVNQVSVPMMTSGWTVSIKTGSSVRLFLMLWKLIIKVLKVFLFFCLLWGSLVVRFGDDVAKWSSMQESLSSASRVDAFWLCSEYLSINTVVVELSLIFLSKQR
jgi:hypothetical protein